jgi:hypothetical protein
MAKRTEITIETARVIVISKPKRMIAWCNQCNKEVDWVTVDEAARLAGTSSRQVFQMVEDGELHSIETDEGILVVCPDLFIRTQLTAHGRSTPEKEMERSQEPEGEAFSRCEQPNPNRS